jgi:glycerol-3-phosphate acyltransferase PlsY
MLAGVLVVAASYLIGAIPFSFLVARAFGVKDVRRVGSGNVGATNVLRSAGRPAGVLAFLLDAGKGALATAVAGRMVPADATIPALAALAAVVGHMYPVWLRFQGGKGVATGFGAFALLEPAAAGGAVLAFAVTAGLSHFVSLGSVVGALTLAALAVSFEAPSSVVATTGCAALLVLWRHRANLRRILGGTERRMGAPRS